MNKAIIAALAFISLAVANAEEKAISPVEAKPFKAEYTIYAGELGNQQSPTKSERKLSIEVSGQAAKEIFDSIYPDAKVKCSDEKGERLRRKKDVWCIYQPRDGYRCFLGFDLRTGDSIPGGSC
jgi:hypothetical protein